MSPPQRLLMGTSTISQVSTHTSTYLGNKIAPGQIFIGAINVTNNVPVKTTKKVIVNHTSKKLSAGDDIFMNHKYKFKPEELRIVFKFYIIHTK